MFISKIQYASKKQSGKNEFFRYFFQNLLTFQTKRDIIKTTKTGGPPCCKHDEPCIRSVYERYLIQPDDRHPVLMITHFDRICKRIREYLLKALKTKNRRAVYWHTTALHKKCASTTLYNRITGALSICLNKNRCAGKTEFPFFILFFRLQSNKLRRRKAAEWRKCMSNHSIPALLFAQSFSALRRIQSNKKRTSCVRFPMKS